MNRKISQASLKPFEIGTIVVGFLLAGIVIGVTGVSYILYSPFPIRWLVWLIGVAFIAVALLAFEWSRAYRNSPGEMPQQDL